MVSRSPRGLAGHHAMDEKFHFSFSFLWSCVLLAGGLFVLITWRLWFGFSFIISRRSYKETFRRGPHNWSSVLKLLCLKGICNFYNKIDDVFTEVSVIVREDKSIF